VRLEDGFGRLHDDLRISVTDRCNLRCAYCMPEEPEWFPRREILSFEEIAHVARLAVGCGVRKLRVTGGEPLVRRDLPYLIDLLSSVPGVEDLSLTTNALLLERLALDLAAAGLRRVNVSLDTLDAGRYRDMTRRDGLASALAGIAAAAAAGLKPIKVNTVLMRGVNDDEVESLAERAREQGWELRFIEFMPLENGGRWNDSLVVAGDEARRHVGARWPIRSDPAGDPNSPATRWLYEDGRGAVGFVDSVSRPFCGGCTRLRLTCDGKLRVCLYDQNEVDLKTTLRSGARDAEVLRLIAGAVRAKGRGGALEILERRATLPLTRTMHQIGG
jgi:cyclic pyranopterin phosphate synthase